MKKVLEIQPDVVFLDIKMPGMEGIEVLKEIFERTNDVQVIMISGHGTVQTAVDSLKMGAFDYIQRNLWIKRRYSSSRETRSRKNA